MKWEKYHRHFSLDRKGRRVLNWGESGRRCRARPEVQKCSRYLCDWLGRCDLTDGLLMQAVVRSVSLTNCDLWKIRRALLSDKIRAAHLNGALCTARFIVLPDRILLRFCQRTEPFCGIQCRVLRTYCKQPQTRHHASDIHLNDPSCRKSFISNFFL